MKISILGCGWLGVPLAESLIKNGHVVAGSTTREERMMTLRHAGVEPWLILLSDAPLQESAFFDCDVLIISIPPNRKKGMTDEFLLKLGHVMNVVEKCRTRHVLFTSSTSVYPDTNGVVREEDEMKDSYMVQAEAIVRRSSFNTTIIRLGGLFGPGRHPGRFLAGKTDVAGADAPVNLIHAGDAVAIIQNIIEQDAWNDVYNACADAHPTRAEFYTRMALNAGLPPPVFSPANETPFKIVSSEKVKQRLNYAFMVPDPLQWRG